MNIRQSPLTILAAALPLAAPLAALAADWGAVHYGRRLVTETYALIGPEVREPEMRYAGNNLACANCHIGGGHIGGGLGLVGVSAKYPARLPGGGTETLAARVNHCMTRSMNGRPLPEEGPEMAGILAYLDMLTRDAASFGDPPEDPPPLAPVGAPDPARGERLYLAECAACHRPDGAGMRAGAPGEALGYLHPPLWGPDSFNAGAGMHRIATAAAFIHGNMPPGATPRSPTLTPEDAWDIAAYVESQPRPPAPPD